MAREFDVAVVGGGVVGLAHAWMAARRGHRVALFERSPVAHGASVRNFGMIWPIGQPAGERYSLAMRSREFWLELKQQNVIAVEPCGAFHLAHRADELAVLEEFSAQQTHACQLSTADDTLQRAPLANPQGLLGSLWSPTELRVDPRTASAAIADWLKETLDVTLFFSTPIARIDGRKLSAADGRNWSAERIILCSGSDLQTLFPESLQSSGLQLCKLQMLKTVPQLALQAGGPHVASGLTLRHYQSFSDCASLPKLKARVAEETPELDRYGIHVMASTTASGEVILGDSHEYGEDITPFDNAEIDGLMLRELQKVIQLDDWNIAERWHGIYAKHPSLLVFEDHPADHVHVVVGPGGAGMTMSFGIAERAWNRWEGSNHV